MNDDRWRRIKEVFAGASGRQGAEREAFLAHACAGDADLRADVEALLNDPTATDSRAQSLSPSQPAGQAPPAAAHAAQPHLTNGKSSFAAAPITEGPGTIIGPYKLLQRVGEGGFGVVFMAEQQQPVRRRVALKIIKLGMDTRRVVARFEAERQALAMMDHPNIARVFDAGATETGRPYFVMELVRGDPITEFCDRNNLSIRERLDLFTQVCNAVQHAHTKGVMHRDIKPGNVLVGRQDGRPHAKVIDFGIAKATDQQLTEKTLFTELKAFIGTPAYMSPEQADGGLDVDMRTDVYSLGVLMYELITGTTPFDDRQLRNAAHGELQRIIREVEPPKPSTRLSSLATSPVAASPVATLPVTTSSVATSSITTSPVAQPPSPFKGEGRGEGEELQRDASSSPRSRASSLDLIARHRASEPRKLGLLIRGDLDWIVMKAMDKDRNRRYETANAFAADVHRHLAGEPVVAAPPSIAYRVRKFIRKHRGQVVATAAVFAALIVGIAGTFWQWRNAETANHQLENLLGTALTGIAQITRDADPAATGVIRKTDSGVVVIPKYYILGLKQFEPPCPVDELKGSAITYESPDEAIRSLIALGQEHATIAKERIISLHQQRDEAQLEAYIARINAAQTAMSAHNWPEARDLLDGCPKDKRGWEWKFLRHKAATILWSIPNYVTSANFSPDSKHVLLTSENSVWLVNAATGEQIGDTLKHDDTVMDAAFSPDSSHVLTTTRYTVRAWDAMTGAPNGNEFVISDKTRVYDPTDYYQVAMFSHDRRHVISTHHYEGNTQSAQLWNLATRSLVGEPIELGKYSYKKNVKFSRDDQLVAIFACESVQVLNVTTGARISEIRFDEGSPDHITFSPDNSRILITTDGVVGMWDVSTGKKRNEIPLGVDSDGTSAVFNRDGSRILTTCNSTAQLWDAETRQPLHWMSGDSWIHDGRFSPDDECFLTTSCYDGIVQLWSQQGQQIATLELPSEDLDDDAFEDDRTFASVFSDDAKYAMIILGGPAYLVSMERFNWPEQRVSGEVGLEIAAMMDDGESTTTTKRADSRAEPRPSDLDVVGRKQELGSGQRKNDPAENNELSPILNGPDLDQKDDINATINPDGSRRVVTKKDGSIRFYETASNREIAVIRGKRPSNLQFTNDGARLILTFGDAVSLVWDTREFAARQADRDARFAERKPAEVYVSKLLDGQTPWDALKQSVRDDKNLAPLQRAIVMEVLLEQMARRRYEAGSAFEAIKKEHMTPVRVQSAIEKWAPDVEAIVQRIRKHRDHVALDGRRFRDALRELAKDWKPDEYELNELAWDGLQSPGATPQRFEAAFDAAREAAKIAPKEGDIVFTLGAALYRHGDYAAALATWDRASHLGVSATKEMNESRAAFFAMALHGLGRHEEARTSLEKLRQTLGQVTNFRGKLIGRRAAIEFNDQNWSGTGSIELAADGRSFIGLLRKGKHVANEPNEKAWAGEKFADSNLNHLDGLWDTSFGRMYLFTDGDKVHGYCGIEPCVAEAIMMIEGGDALPTSAPSTQPAATQPAATQATTKPADGANQSSPFAPTVTSGI